MRRSLLAMLVVVLLAGCGSTSFRNVRPVGSESMSLEHRGGAYAVQPADISLFKATGLTLAMSTRPPDPAPAGVVYLDSKLLSIWRNVALGLHCKRSGAPCPISAQKPKILAAVAKEIARAHTNPAVVGFYILDDYIGNVRPLLERIHALAAAAGLPTVCGFGGTLDFRNAAGGWERDQTSLQHFDARELLNYSPGACDYVATYIYSLGHKAPTSDFSMSGLLPVMLADLKTHGWTAQASPLIGAPQAWEGTPPTAAQVERQTSAFCSAGAVSILAFTWHNFPARSQPELANSPTMRTGLAAGVQDCAKVWG